MLSLGTSVTLVRDGTEGVVRGVRLEEGDTYSYLVRYRVDQFNENEEWVAAIDLRAA